MSEIAQSVLDDLEIIKSDNIAIVDDASYIWNGEHHRSPMDDEVQAKDKTPIFIMLPFLIRQLERSDVKLVYIDGTADRYSITTETDTGLEYSSASDIVNCPPLNGIAVKTNLALYFKTYYLLRFYLFGGSKKYAVTKLNEGFVVYTNDSENPHVWAGHKVY